MKKLFSKLNLCILFSFSMLITGSCTKDKPADEINSASDYYVRFKLDGNSILYTKTAEGNINVVDNDGHYDCSIAGLKDENVSNKGTMVILMVTTNPMTTGNTYTNFGTTSGGNVRTLLGAISRYDDAGTFFASWGDEFSSSGVDSDTRINFTEITETYIKGNFSGTMYKEINGNAEKHLVSEGEFRVRRLP